MTGTETDPLEALLEAKTNLEGVAMCLDLNALQFDNDKSMDARGLQYLVCQLNAHVRALGKAVNAVEAELRRHEAKAKKKPEA